MISMLKPTTTGKISRRTNRMYVISDSCVACGTCSDTCPNEAISMDDGLGRYVIDGGKCVDCGSCADACPMSCISQE